MKKTPPIQLCGLSRGRLFPAVDRSLWRSRDRGQGSWGHSSRGQVLQQWSVIKLTKPVRSLLLAARWPTPNAACQRGLPELLRREQWATVMNVNRWTYDEVRGKSIVVMDAHILLFTRPILSSRDAKFKIHCGLYPL